MEVSAVMFPSESPATSPFQTDEVDLVLIDDETGAERRTTGHLAVVDGRLYLRPRGGRRSAWARALAARDTIAIAIEGARLPVTAQPVHDAGTLRRVTEALLARFQYHAAMPRLLEDASIAGTVQLVPAA